MVKPAMVARPIVHVLDDDARMRTSLGRLRAFASLTPVAPGDLLHAIAIERARESRPGGGAR